MGGTYTHSAGAGAGAGVDVGVGVGVGVDVGGWVGLCVRAWYVFISHSV